MNNEPLTKKRDLVSSDSRLRQTKIVTDLTIKEQFYWLIDSLEEQGWNEDIIDDLKILKRKYEKEWE